MKHLRRVPTLDKRYGLGLPAVSTLLAIGLAVGVSGVHAQDNSAPKSGDTTKKQTPAASGKDSKTKAAAAKDGKQTATKKPGDSTTKAVKVAPGRSVPPAGPGTGPAGAPGTGGPPITIFQGPGGQGGPGGPGGGGRGFGGAAAGTKFSFDFHGSDISNVLKFYSQMSNMTVVADPGLSGQVTIINPKQVTLDEAFTILQSVLAVRGFTAIQQGPDTISIQPFASAARTTPLMNTGLAENGHTRVDPRNQVMTQVIPLENVDAGALAKELQPLINTGASLIASTGTNVLILTDTASNVERFIDLTASLDKTSNQTELKTYALKSAEAGAVADIINNLFKQTSPRGQSGAAPQPGQPGFNPGAPQQPGQAAGGVPAVVAVPDVRTNSVLVVASPGTQERIATDIINKLDDDQTNVLDTQARKINYADATQVANTVNTILSNMHNGGAASSSSSQPSFQSRAFGGGGFGGFFGGGNNNSSSQTPVNSTDPFAKLTADARTNTVFISASPDRMKKINELIDQLDANVPVEPTTFVFNLKNANADDVSYALSQAFGTSNSNSNNPFGFFGGGGGGGGGNNGLNGNQHTPIQRRLTSTQGQAGRAASPNRPYSTPPPAPPNAPGDPQATGDGTTATGGSAIPQGVPGVMTPSGFVPTDTGNTPGANGQEPTRQFGFFGGRFGQQQNTGPTSGRGQSGNFTNLLQLRDNVYVTSAPGGDSVIVTTTPDNYEAVRQIIASLDAVPRQVMIEAIVAEVTITKDSELGFSANGLLSKILDKNNTGSIILNVPGPNFVSGSPNTTTVNNTAVGLQSTITGVNYSGLIQALESDTRVKVLATPRVFTSNSQEAEVDITTKIPYIQGTTTATTGASTSQITTADIGYILNVTPRITRQGQVTLDVRSQADNLQSYTTLGSGANASVYPVVNDRYVDTEVTAQDGQTIVLGGLINTTDTLNVTKIPLLSDIPLLGQFFRGRQKTTTKTELVIFLTPHVINSAQEATDMTNKAAAPVLKDMKELSQEQPNIKELPAIVGGSNGTPSNTKGVKKPAAPNGNPPQPNGAPTNPNGNGAPPNNGGLNPNTNGGNNTP